MRRYYEPALKLKTEIEMRFKTKNEIKALVEEVIDKVKETHDADPVWGLLTILCANMSVMMMTLVDIRDILNDSKKDKKK